MKYPFQTKAYIQTSRLESSRMDEIFNPPYGQGAVRFLVLCKSTSGMSDPHQGRRIVSNRVELTTFLTHPFGQDDV